MSDEERPRAQAWQRARIPVGDLRYDGPQPLNEHLAELIGATMTGERKPDIRHLPVRNLVTRDEDVMSEYLTQLIAEPPPPPQTPLFVVEISQRRYWAFDNPHAVRAWQQTNPELMVAVDVLMTYASSAKR